MKPESASTPIAAIAGGVAGGVVAIIAIAGIAWFLIRRKRQAADDSANDSMYRNVLPGSSGTQPNMRPGSQEPAEVSNESPYSELSGHAGAGYGRAGPIAEKDLSGYGELPHTGTDDAELPYNGALSPAQEPKYRGFSPGFGVELDASPQVPRYT